MIYLFAEKCLRYGLAGRRKRVTFVESTKQGVTPLKTAAANAYAAKRCLIRAL